MVHTSTWVTLASFVLHSTLFHSPGDRCTISFIDLLLVKLAQVGLARQAITINDDWSGYNCSICCAAAALRITAFPRELVITDNEPTLTDLWYVAFTQHSNVVVILHTRISSSEDLSALVGWDDDSLSIPCFAKPSVELENWIIVDTGWRCWRCKFVCFGMTWRVRWLVCR